MTETCISQILYEFNIIWRNIMRKENEAIKTKYTLQVQDLRRQLVTKKAFDEDESQREISRLKKELQFVQMQVYNTKRMKGLASGPSKENFDQNQPSSSALARADAQAKQDLENENEILRSKIDQMENGSRTSKSRITGGVGANSSYRDDMGGLGNKSYLSSEIM